MFQRIKSFDQLVIGATVRLSPDTEAWSDYVIESVSGNDVHLVSPCVRIQIFVDGTSRAGVFLSRVTTSSMHIVDNDAWTIDVDRAGNPITRTVR